MDRHNAPSITGFSPQRKRSQRKSHPSPQTLILWKMTWKRRRLLLSLHRKNWLPWNRESLSLMQRLSKKQKKSRLKKCWKSCWPAAWPQMKSSKNWNNNTAHDEQAHRLLIVGISFYTVFLWMTVRLDFELCRFSFYPKLWNFQNCIQNRPCGVLLV